MGNLATTYQHIADILSFETNNSELEQKFSDPLFNWDSIVVEGSKHLVLPAIYCRLKAKNILHVLPKELNTYLEDITSINRNRNLSIIEQVHSLSGLLNSHKIDHVFLKGAALLISGYYNDIAERMVGDIDVLIAIDQLDDAHELLKHNDYISLKMTLGERFFEHIHLPRLKPKSHICSVELHKKLFVSYQYKPLETSEVLTQKRKHNDINIPHHTHILMHNILSYQINDYGNIYNSINLRSAYDTVILLKTYNSRPAWSNENVFRKYFNYSGLFFKDIRHVTNSEYNYSTAFYLFKLKHIKFYKFWNKLIFLINYTTLLSKRLFLFLVNKSYREGVIRERNRIYSHFLSIIYKS